MSARIGMVLPLVLLGPVTPGCTPSEADGPAASGPIAAPVSATAGQGARENEVSLRIADETGLAEVIRSHRGSVVFVDFWATWCAPCMKLFPHTVELHKQLAGEGLVVISVSFDDPESEPEVRRILAQKGAVFENLLSPYGVTPKAFEAFEIEDGVLPHIRLYDRAGLARKSFGAVSGVFTTEDIDKAVRQLLEQP